MSGGCQIEANVSEGTVEGALAGPPVLVYGPRKAGTTLLQNLLDGGQEMLMLPGELKLKYMTRPGWPAGKPAARWFVERGRGHFRNLFRVGDDGKTVQINDPRGFAALSSVPLDGIFDMQRYVAGLEGMLRENPSAPKDLILGEMRAFIAAFRDGVGNRTRWGSKEVGGVPSRIISLFKECFPEGKVVYLVRQPEFITRSIILDRRRRGKRMSLRSLIHECRDAQNVVNYGHHHHDQGGLVISYEALTENTAAVISDVCQELGLPQDPVHLGPTILGSPVVVSTSSRKTTEVFRQAGDWKDGLTFRELFAVRLFRLFGPLYYRAIGQPKTCYAALRKSLAEKNR